MVKQIQAQRTKQFILTLIPGKETHIEVSRLNRDPVRLAGIKARQGLGDILHGIGVFQFVPKNNHTVTVSLADYVHFFRRTFEIEALAGGQKQ